MRVTVDEAIALLTSGSVIGMPTETVYGLAASLAFPEAIEAIFRIKKRVPEKPLSIAISSLAMLHRFHPVLSKEADALMRAFWPGPLTLVLEADTTAIPSLVNQGLPTIGFRMPDHPLALSLIESVGPLILTSANLSGEAPALSVDAILQIFGEAFPVVDGGSCREAVPSTVVAFHDGLQVVRDGAITRAAIAEVSSAKRLP